MKKIILLLMALESSAYTLEMISMVEKFKPSSFSDMFASDDGIKLQKATINVATDMNNGAAVKMHLVIVYSKELVSKLSTLRSDRYFEMVDQLKRDYPEQMKIFAWEIIAKEQMFPSKIEYPRDHMTPLAGFIFVSYTDNNRYGNGGLNNNMSTSIAGQTSHPYRARVPPSSEEIEIYLEKDNFKILPTKKNE